jgi:hypothetical protein
MPCPDPKVCLCLLTPVVSGVLVVFWVNAGRLSPLANSGSCLHMRGPGFGRVTGNRGAALAEDEGLEAQNPCFRTIPGAQVGGDMVTLGKGRCDRWGVENRKT